MAKKFLEIFYGARKSIVTFRVLVYRVVTTF